MIKRMSYLIIGGGIAGLYSAYCLHKHFGVKQITILEKTNRLGGRIETMNYDGIPLELGAGVISDVQKNVYKLLEELGLINKLDVSSTGRSMALIKTVNVTNPEIKQVIPTMYQIEKLLPIDQSDFYPIMEDITRKLSDPTFYYIAESYTLYDLVEKFYGLDSAHRLTYLYGYPETFSLQHSLQTLHRMNGEFRFGYKFYKLKLGLSEIIRKLEDYIRSNNIVIKLDSPCLSLEKVRDKYRCLSNNEIIDADNVIMAITKKDLLHIDFFSGIKDKLEYVVTKSSMRIYLRFPVVDGKPWFSDIDTIITTDTILGQIIPYDKERGILLVYCEGRNTMVWNQLQKSGLFKIEIHYHLARLFSDTHVPEPLDIVSKYYSEATHAWKPGFDPETMFKKIIQPFNNERVYIVGEAYSLHQQWIAGAIQSVDYLMSHFISPQMNKNNNK